MNHPIRLKTTAPPLLITLALAVACFGLLPQMQALSPPPEGCYPTGNTTAAGCNALGSLTTGVWNTGLGFHALSSDTTGNDNTAVGMGALWLNNAHANTATGVAALLLNTTGYWNTANGAAALLNNDSGIKNTAVGTLALNLNTTASFNTAIGDEALSGNTTGGSNTANGAEALLANTSGHSNTASGSSALYSNHIGSWNTANGVSALWSNSAGSDNTAIGAGALLHNTTGGDNTAVGFVALGNSTGSDNTALGESAGSGVTTATNVICIGKNVAGTNASNSCFVGNIWNQPGGSQAVYVNSDGKLGAQVSSRCFKDDIKPINQASEAIHRLRPVSFRYKAEVEPTRPVGFGLIAEEVAAVNPALVVRDKDGKPYSVRYDAVNAMLLNEFLKEHRKVQEQEATIAVLKSTDAKQEVIITQLKSTDAKHEAIIARQQKQIEALTTGLQKVNDQLKMSKPAPQIVNNP